MLKMKIIHLQPGVRVCVCSVTVTRYSVRVNVHACARACSCARVSAHTQTHTCNLHGSHNTGLTCAATKHGTHSSRTLRILSKFSGFPSLTRCPCCTRVRAVAVCVYSLSPLHSPHTGGGRSAVIRTAMPVTACCKTWRLLYEREKLTPFTRASVVSRPHQISGPLSFSALIRR